MLDHSDKSSRDALLEQTLTEWRSARDAVNDAVKVELCKQNAFYVARGGGGYPHSDCPLCEVSHSVQGVRTVLME